MPPTADLLQAYGGLRFPGPADWLPWQQPTLRWNATPGAGYYNVQVFRGQRRVLNAWSPDTRLRVPDGRAAPGPLVRVGRLARVGPAPRRPLRAARSAARRSP